MWPDSAKPTRTVSRQAYGNIMGGLGADPSSVTWVNTAIYTAEALGLPMAAFFAKNYGRKNTVMAALLIVIGCYVLPAVGCQYLRLRLDCKRKK